MRNERKRKLQRCILVAVSGVLVWFVALSNSRSQMAGLLLNSTEIVERKSQRVLAPTTVVNKSLKGQCLLRNMTTSERDCVRYSKEENRENSRFPLHYVSGVPGSGNDWILWLASPSRYTWTPRAREYDCSIYKRNWRGENYKMSATNSTDCLFLKSHEPWYYERVINTYAKKVGLLIRHPYDSAFAEYKRRLVEKRGISQKSMSSVLSVSQFLDVNSNKTTKDWGKYQFDHVRAWLSHATYWLTEATQPVHVILYTSVRDDPTNTVEGLQSFFGYKFNGSNFRRHCCVMRNPINPELKRQHSTVDKYKELMYQDREIHQIMENSISDVHRMLDQKFPGENYRILRG